MTNVQKIRAAYRTKAEARARLKALKKLLSYYKRELYGAGCPLCPLGGISCSACPWKIFTGDTCSPYRHKHFPGSETLVFSDGGHGQNRAYRQARLQQLPKWIFAYEQALRSW